ncbi:MAG: tripartite tricarboxylate transporter permease [Mycobacterium sp.]
MIDAALSALAQLTSIETLGYMMLGVLVGTVVGIMPGMGGIVGVSLMLPLIFGMDQAHGIALLIGLVAVTNTSEVFPSVLLGIPGSAGAQATVMDGYPLARRGEGARALAAGFTSSMLGGVIGAAALFVIIGMIQHILGFVGNPELLALSILGLAIVGVLVRGDMVLGLIAALFGVALGTIGSAPAVLEYRYTFGWMYLFDGIPLEIVALGFFAIPEAVALLVSRGSIAKGAKLGRGIWHGVRDTLRHWTIVVRSALIGVGIGSIPGVSGTVVDWVAYGVNKQLTKTDPQYGNGDIRGVIAPESANNSKEGGALVPTLSLGIPGSGTTAVLMGGLILLGLTPGPEMIANDLDKVLLIAWALALANVVSTVLCVGLSHPISKITLVPGYVLGPIILVFAFGLAYQASWNIGDLILLAVFGAIGVMLKVLRWPRAPIIIGFALAPNIERYLHLSISRYGYEWVTRPVVLAIFALILVLVFGGALARTVRRSTRRPGRVKS